MISAHPRLLAAAALLIAALPLAACSNDPPPAPSSTEDPADILEGLEDETESTGFEPVFAIPESCDGIDFTTIIEDHRPVTGGDVTDSSETGRLQCSYTAMDENYSVYSLILTIEPNDWLRTAGEEPVVELTGPYYESTGSLEYAGWAAYQADPFNDLYYILPGLAMHLQDGTLDPNTLDQKGLEALMDDFADAAAGA